MRICPRKQRSVTWPGVWQVLCSSHLQPRVCQFPFAAWEHLLVAGKSAWLWGGGCWCCQGCVPRNPRQIPALAAGTEGAQLLLGVVSTQLCLQQLPGDEFHQQESCSYKFNFESDPSTSANVFRLLDLLGVNSVSASEQRARAGTVREDSLGQGLLRDTFTAWTPQNVCSHGLSFISCAEELFLTYCRAWFNWVSWNFSFLESRVIPSTSENEMYTCKVLFALSW